MGLKSIVAAIPLETIDSSTLTANYQAINPGGFEAPVAILRLKNTTNDAVTLSYDGDNDHDYLAPDDVVVYEFQANSHTRTNQSALPTGTVVYAKGTAGNGLVSLSGWYQPNR